MPVQALRHSNYLLRVCATRWICLRAPIIIGLKKNFHCQKEKTSSSPFSYRNPQVDEISTNLNFVNGTCIRELSTTFLKFQFMFTLCYFLVYFRTSQQSQIAKRALKNKYSMFTFLVVQDKLGRLKIIIDMSNKGYLIVQQTNYTYQYSIRKHKSTLWYFFSYQRHLRGDDQKNSNIFTEHVHCQVIVKSIAT